MARLVDALPSGSLGVNFNPGHFIANGFSAQDALVALGKHIVHIHAKDAVRDASQRRALDVPLGSGSVEFPELLARLEEFQYRGYLTVVGEYSSNPQVELAHAVRYLRNS